MLINKIYTDGYERIVVLEETGTGEKIIAHFLEYDEYLENNMTSVKKKAGDIIKCDISIDLVTFNKLTDMELMHRQPIENSSHIKAVVKVSQIIDDYSIYALSSIINDKILIEFENAVDYKVNDKILIEGSLELHF
ncbi:MAG: hypothetical protein HDT39_14075 [Lachnospiraceae bacterium]|nr:hypothetical protein [Lachnospiraceae bacterium]